MMRTLIFVLCLIMSAGVAAQVTPEVKRDQDRQDVASEVVEYTSDQRADVSEASSAVIAAQVQENEGRLERIETQMSGTETFWLEIVKTIATLIAAVGVPFLLYQNTQAANARKELAKAVNGRTTDLVTTARAEGFFEGAKLAGQRTKNKEADDAFRERVVEIQQQMDSIVAPLSKQGHEDTGPVKP